MPSPMSAVPILGSVFGSLSHIEYTVVHCMQTVMFYDKRRAVGFPWNDLEQQICSQSMACVRSSKTVRACDRILRANFRCCNKRYQWKFSVSSDYQVNYPCEHHHYSVLLWHRNHHCLAGFQRGNCVTKSDITGRYRYHVRARPPAARGVRRLHANQFGTT